MSFGLQLALPQQPGDRFDARVARDEDPAPRVKDLMADVSSLCTRT